MTRVLILSLAALGLTACGAVTGGNSQGGFTSSSMLESDQAQIDNADKHCSKYGKVARFGNTIDPWRGTKSFACVKDRD